VLAGLAAGLKGIAPGNTWLRPCTALQAWLGGRFPDQGTIHRWLDQTTAAQANALRDHLHHVVGTHGRFWKVLRSRQLLVVDVDGQGLVARGQHFEAAARGSLGQGLDNGYQRYVASAATHEVLDDFRVPGNKTLLSPVPQRLRGLSAGIPPTTATACWFAATPTWAPSATCVRCGSSTTTTSARCNAGRPASGCVSDFCEYSSEINTAIQFAANAAFHASFSRCEVEDVEDCCRNVESAGMKVGEQSQLLRELVGNPFREM
jgi:hypothetical protein